MRSQIKMLSLFFTFFILGCGTIQVKMDDELKGLKKCEIVVIDERPDKRFFCSGLYPINIIPSLQEFLALKICSDDKLRMSLISNKAEVHIEDIRIHTAASSPVHMETVFEIIGFLKMEKEAVKIHSHASYESAAPGVWFFIPPAVSKSSDDFILKTGQYFEKEAKK